MKILGIESSCDETAAAVVEDGKHILSNVVHSQIDIHAVYGGVVPEVAARSHIEMINPVINRALSEANLSWDDIDAIAVSYAPGLVGSLLVGTLAARTLAITKNKSLYPVHHVKSHVYSNFLRDNQPEFPMLALIVSGGHSQLVLFQDHDDYQLLGQTTDDAIGEAFDKVAKILGLTYPGGPAIAAAAEHGDPNKYQLPIAKFKCTHKGAHTGMIRKAQPSSETSHIGTYDERATQTETQRNAQEVCHYYDYSFSGLKTAVLRAVQREVGVDFNFPSTQLAARLNNQQRNDFAASFQKTAVETLVDQTAKAFHDNTVKSFVLAGGVAANSALRAELIARLPIEITFAPIELCTDNAAMVASLGYYESIKNQPANPYELEVQPSLSM